MLPQNASLEISLFLPEYSVVAIPKWTHWTNLRCDALWGGRVLVEPRRWGCCIPLSTLPASFRDVSLSRRSHAASRK
ncbi:hypothetical protein CesoFtcFv8_000700 [Champsocephalus esox]|uniref:Uncharacterized protein n=1 Tax=Champsocephalus esox TaxID=159716 RepID=A0AAN8D5S6_9TELE|nr:hypothetical protein CesoFtcFv8_000700 [Champsocephalus esox]